MIEALVAIVFLAFGASLGFLTLWKIYHVVKASIEKNKHENKIAITEEDFDRMARAFIEHKKEMSQRLKNIEASLDGNPQNSVRIESPEERNSSPQLNNDLNQKQRVQQ
ncbi:hypothetical protein [Fodinibius salsisoli]|uniref:Phage shock protein B n=1 Tax=Fodinibius salsisoli TaxID=2820877 RepID=A0ABT3PLT8_9BACT|nr:hypothetical protein [Fodinibius salsisoli]MCW9706906.1 hypothetical protein [Fodinibius salsisoli]